MSEPYTLERHPSFDKDIKKLSPAVRQGLAGAIRKVGEDPRGPGCKQAKGHRDWLIRFARHYRLIYGIDDASRHVRLLVAGHRGKVYDTYERRMLGQQ